MMAEVVETIPQSWDFKPIYDLLDAFHPASHFPNSEALKTPSSPSLLAFDPKSSEPASLGDFNRLFEFLGKPINTPLSNPSYESIESSSFLFSDNSTLPSSATEDVALQTKEVRWTDELGDGQDLTEIRQRSSHEPSVDLNTNSENEVERSPHIAQTPSRKSRRSPRGLNSYTSEPESEADIGGTRQSTTRARRSVQRALRASTDVLLPSTAKSTTSDEVTPLSIIAKNPALIPSSLAPRPKPTGAHTLWVPPPPIPRFALDPLSIQPIDTLTREEKLAKLVKKLKKRFGTVSIDQAARSYGGIQHPRGIHVFVDCSNITIGFYNELKMRRGIQIHSRLKNTPLSWQSLALILERGRPVARQILVGSNGPATYGGTHPRLPDYIVEAESCGYEVNILDRVAKYKDPTPTKRMRRGAGNGYATTSGYSSGSDGTYMSQKVMMEQAVDEILHMKLLESIVDTTEPSTMVLATGDAAEAEYSGGFLKNVERALQKGWKVELVAWSSGLSKDYKGDFLSKWAGRFSIITLDDFSEELLALYDNASLGGFSGV